MRSAILGPVLTAAAALALTAAAPAAQAATTASPVLVASCTATISGTYTSPLDPGGTNAQQADTLQQTGTITCVDDAGQPLVRGTMTRTTILPAAQCSGIAYSDPSTNTINWTDGTTTSLTLDQANVVSVLGAASTTGTGTATTNSTKFAGDSIDGAVMGTGPGCGTPSGQTTVNSTVVFTLAH
ncbi:hypothetical protein ABH920_001699 [Catenulispora sp. EB89]|uniref:hypothetical protein n=1 Tax=Catenulispora sp. EB89 TaxID=3156257 RepID=UPI003515E8AD